MNRDDMTRDEVDRYEMTDAIYPDDLVLRIADIGTTRVRTLVGNDIGPAGICSLALADGSTVHVDYAEPERLISLDPSGDAPVLDLLIGPERARFARTAAPLGDDQAIRLPGRRTSRDRDVVSSLPRGGDDARALGLAAALDAVHHDEDELPLVRAVAGFEFADRVQDLVASRIVDRDEVVAVVNRSLDLAVVHETGPGSIAELGTKPAMEVRQFLQQAIRATALEDDRRARRVDRALLDGPFDVPADERRRPDDLRRVAAMRVAITTTPLRAFYADMPAAADLSPAITMTSPGRLHIEWSTRPDGDWVRVLRAGSQVLLALAPVVTDGDGVWAETVVPPDLGVDDIAVDTLTAVGRDGLAPGTPAERVRAAVDLGRLAVVAAVGRRRDAAELWRRCAEAWAEIGDDRRARRAMAYADGELEVTRRRTLTDRVRVVVDRP